MRVWALALGSWLTTVASAASGYGYDSPITTPCHETMTANALRDARAKWPNAIPVETTAEDRLILDDLVFTVPPDLQDIGATTLLIGVRDHDLKGESGIDTQELAALHGDDDSQAEHCLRRAEHDEPGGSAAAVTECRELVRELTYAAIDAGLNGEGRIDGSRRQTVAVHLAFRRRTELSLPIFHLRLGQALHTLQDSFSHSFRTPDHRRITVALNWVDQVTGDLDESRDGPGHMRALDICLKLDELRQGRLDAAREATSALVAAVFDHGSDKAAKKRAVDDVLARYMAFEPGCSFDNGWCAAPERDYADDACTCQAPGGPGRDGAGSWLGAALLLMGIVRRRG